MTSPRAQLVKAEVPGMERRTRPAIAIRLVGARPEPESDNPCSPTSPGPRWLGWEPVKSDNLRSELQPAASASAFGDAATKVPETVVATRCVPPHYSCRRAFRSVRVGRGPFAFWGALAATPS